MGKCKYTPKQINNVVRDYRKGKLTAREIGKKWGMNVHSVYYYTIYKGVSKKEEKTSWSRQPISANTVSNITKDRECGLSVKIIANKYSVSPATVYKYAKIAKKRQVPSWSEFLSQRFNLLNR